MASNAQSGWPPPYVRAFAILDTTPSEPHPDGQLVVNLGGVLSNYVKVTTGSYTFKLNQPSGVATLDKIGVHVTATSDSSASEDANFASYTIELVTDQPSLLHVFVFDAAGAHRDAVCVTITLYGVASQTPA